MRVNHHPGSLNCALAAACAAAVAAQAAPNIQGVVQNNGYTDRPPAKMTGETFDIMNGATLVKAGYTVGLFDVGAKAMTDRAHAYIGASATLPLPSYLVGNEYLMIANNNRDKTTFSLDLTVSRPSAVYLLVDNRLGDNDAATPPTLGASAAFMKWVDPANGWNPFVFSGNRASNPAQPDEVGIDEGADGTVNNWSSVYVKTVPAGTFSLAEFGEAGRNMYGVVVAPTAIPEPSIGALLALGVGGLFAWSRRR
jgi:hypothetical protein